VDYIVSRLRAALDGRYSIDREIGAGGMATVYLAQDLKHNRPVAIKVLDPDLAAAIGGERFLREIETTANLRHPHILPLYDSGEADGLLFYVMPLVEGESLRKRLARESRLEVADAIRLAREVAEALAYAHAHGVVHRDIKPDNILIESGHAIVADFGIARAVRAAGTSTLTATGSSLGTPAYMSPEQAAGEQTLDGRADQYALACVIYEMLAGEPPFTGPTAASVVHQHMIAEAPPLTHRRAGVPGSIAYALQRALSKDPTDRFPSMEDFAAALGGSTSDVPSFATPPKGRRDRKLILPSAGALLVIASTAGWWLSRGGTASQQGAVPLDAAMSIPDISTDPSIAVLPLANLSGEKEQEFFSDGISEELTNLLATVPGVRVIARTSAFSFKGKQATVPQIARALHVAAILEGSVRKSGERVRIDVRVVRAKDGSQLWADTYDRTLDDIFKVQDEIASAVVKQLQLKLLTVAPRAREANPKAYALDLQGQFLVRQGTPESRAQGIDRLKQALAIDPRVVSAWNGLAGAYFSQASNSERPPAEGRRLAREAVSKALQIDPNDAVALSLRGWIAMNYDNDFVSAANDFQQALAHSPGSGVVGNAAMFVQNLGRLDEAIKATQYQFEHDPANPRIPFNLASTYYFAGRWDDAIATAKTVLAMSPARTSIHATMALALLYKGDPNAALAALQAEPSEEFRLPALAMVQHALGRKHDSDSSLTALIAKFGNDDASSVASVYAYRGEADSAFQWLERAASQGGLANVVIDPPFGALRRDPRWLPYLRKAGKAPEQLAAIKFNLIIPK
jgi:serine/threonine protein kinase/tetratricopeptide (TPR) repeat protein